jgi:periplasmic divalent cation tolerance protein
MSKNLQLVYITVPDKNLASNIAKILVTEGLAACVNIIGPIESVYLWQNNLKEEGEVLLLAKTSNLESLIAKVKELHPYDVPCIISFSITGGEKHFLEWIGN